jgi:hypothetical protein
VGIVAAAVAAGPLAAQTRGQANLVLTIYGGAAGGRALWRVDKQTLTFDDNVGNTPDTVNLDRRVTSALMFGAMVTLYGSGALGVTLDIDYRGLSLDDTCVGVFLQPDGTAERNRTLCDNITALSTGGSVIGVGMSGTLRAIPRGSVSPYVRAGARLSYQSVSAIALDAVESAGRVRTIIEDGSPRRSTIGMLLAAGLTAPVGTGYQFRLEVRDHLASIETMDGPANALGIGPTALKLYHQPSLILALDIVLEQRRGRRY